MSDSILSLFLSEGRRVIGLFLSAGGKLSEKKSNHSERLRTLDDENQRTVHKLAYSRTLRRAFITFSTHSLWLIHFASIRITYSHRILDIRSNEACT